MRFFPQTPEYLIPKLFYRLAAEYFFLRDVLQSLARRDPNTSLAELFVNLSLFHTEAWKKHTEWRLWQPTLGAANQK